MNYSSSLPVQVTVKSIPANYTPPHDMQGVLEAIAQYTDYETPISGPAITISPDDPEQTSADPNGLYIWNRGPSFTLAPQVMDFFRNQWWNVYSGKPNEIRMFACPPTAPYFDGAGVGIREGGWEGWALCDGRGGRVDLRNRFVVPGYRYDASASIHAWITNVGTVLDIGGGPVTTNWPYGVGGGGYGPGVKLSWFSEIETAPGITYSGLTTPAETILAPNDASYGGWARFQFGLWNFSSIDPPVSGVTPGGWPSLNINLVDKTVCQATQFGKDPTKFWPGGVDTIYWVAPHDPLYHVGLWTFKIDQWQQMKNTWMSRLPPYIALGFCQFIGYP